MHSVFVSTCRDSRLNLLASPTLLGFVNCRNHYLLYGQRVLVHILTNLLQMVVKCNALMLLAFLCFIRTKFSRA